MVAEMRAVEFGQPKWGHYALVEIAGGTGLNWGGVGVMWVPFMVNVIGVGRQW